MHRPRLLPSLLALVVLGVAACGDGGGDTAELSSEEQTYADAWARTLSDEEDGFSVEEDEADCMATAMMAEIGTGPFEEADVKPGDIGDGEQGASDADSPGELLGGGVITDEQADTILDGWEECTDLSVTLAAAATSEFDLDEEAETCVAEGIRDEDLARAGLRPSFTSDEDDPPPALLTQLVELIDRCAGGGDSGGVIVDSIAEQLAADGQLTDEEAQCVAQEMVDVIGLERLIELGAGGGALEEADPAVQQAVAQAILGAAQTCGIPLTELGGS